MNKLLPKLQCNELMMTLMHKTNQNLINKQFKMNIKTRLIREQIHGTLKTNQEFTIKRILIYIE